jgi:hypothetical protein
VLVCEDGERSRRWGCLLLLFFNNKGLRGFARNLLLCHHNKMHLVLLSLLLSSATLPVSGWVLAPASPRLQNAGRWGGASSTTTDTSFYRIGFRCTATAAASNLELWLDARTEAGLDSISAYSDRADRVLLAKDQLEVGFINF